MPNNTLGTSRGRDANMNHSESLTWICRLAIRSAEC